MGQLPKHRNKPKRKSRARATPARSINFVPITKPFSLDDRLVRIGDGLLGILSPGDSLGNIKAAGARLLPEPRPLDQYIEEDPDHAGEW